MGRGWGGGFPGERRRAPFSNGIMLGEWCRNEFIGPGMHEELASFIFGHLMSPCHQEPECCGMFSFRTNCCKNLRQCNLIFDIWNTETPGCAVSFSGYSSSEHYLQQIPL